MINALAESYLQGGSTRRIQEIVVHLGLDQLSPSSVSRISKELIEKVDGFLKRPIEHPKPLTGSARISGIKGLSQKSIGRGSGLPMGWKESIRNLKEEAESLGRSQMIDLF